MKVLRPTTFESAMLISSNATESASAWSSGTTYALGAVVDYGDYYYTSLQNSNTNHLPDAAGSTWWTRTGPDNKHAMFDNEATTQTVRNGSLTVNVATGIIDSIYFGNVAAGSIHVIVRDGLGGTVVYEDTQYLDGSTIEDWYEYFFFDPTFLRNQALFTGIPPFASSHVEVTFDHGTSDAKVGIMTFGTIFSFGATEYGATSGIIDYSVKETDDFGNTTFIKRAYSKRMNARIRLDNSNLNRAQRVLYDLRATPAVWIATDDPIAEEALVVYGPYKDFSTEIAYAKQSYCSLEIEGLI